MAARVWPTDDQWALGNKSPGHVTGPQHAGMVLTNTSLTGGLGQTEPRFDAYKSMQIQLRRY